MFEVGKLRKTILDMAYAGSTVHIACAFSIVEILAVLYRSHLNLGNGHPEDPLRDYLVLSKGHGVMAQYACMLELGWLTDDDIQNYFSDGTSLKGLSDAHVAGLEVSSGSLGHGLSVSVGLALGAKRNRTKQKCFAIVGDGELNEGTIWEALMFAVHFKLDNLIVIVDVNGYQAMGSTQEVMDMGNITDKFEAFGFDTLEINGHDEHLLDKTIHELVNSHSDKPKAIIANTIKGKGISFMESDNRWHYTRLTSETYHQAIAELSEKEVISLP
ncbi:transketolase [Pseudanabaena sp. BC1403]|uniref:transketolase n=1 Tax=Pseudanabaena sp. BC1403 TaxID=2043171 RepID=UPI000CD83672|nr:transketolase [Pseudanabaena sp. BC1403]